MLQRASAEEKFQKIMQQYDDGHQKVVLYENLVHNLKLDAQKDIHNQLETLLGRKLTSSEREKVENLNFVRHHGTKKKGRLYYLAVLLLKRTSWLNFRVMLGLSTAALVMFSIWRASSIASLPPAPSPSASSLTPAIQSSETPIIVTATSASSITQLPIQMTSTPKEQGNFYMFVLDASLRMTESFETQTKWDAALRAIDSILVGLEPGANYGLVAIGGASGIGSSDPCGEPSLVTLPFSTREVVGERVTQLQPGGGGSLYTAFILAKNQLETVPENTVRTLIYITGSEDACESKDEWADLERYFRIQGDAGLNIYSEIIIIDSQNGVRSQMIAERINSLSDKVNAQAPQTVFQLLQTNNLVIRNVSNYVNTTIASLPTSTPTLTQTPSVTPSPPSLSPTTSPNVVLTGFDYVGTGEGCSAIVYFQVSGSPATGKFRVWNQWYTENGLPHDPAYPLVTLPLGSNGYQVGLGGNGNPAYYWHKVWFEYEYNGAKSNELDLICPNLTPSP